MAINILKTYEEVLKKGLEDMNLTIKDYDSQLEKEDKVEVPLQNT